MSAPTMATIAGIAVVALEVACLGCERALVCVQLPGVKLQRDDAVCWRCVPAMRRAAA